MITANFHIMPYRETSVPLHPSPRHLESWVQQSVLTSVRRHTWNQTGHNVLPRLQKPSGETRVFNLPKPHVPSQLMHICVFLLEPLNGTFHLIVKCDVSMQLMFMMEMDIIRSYGSIGLQYNWFLFCCFVKAAMKDLCMCLYDLIKWFWRTVLF